MFPVIYSSTSDYCILLPSYNPLIERFARELGTLVNASAGSRFDRGGSGKRAVSRVKSSARPDDRGASPL